LDIVSLDMPFIVDSALAALRAAGGTVRLFTHPVLRVDEGAVGDTGQALSVLHIHSDPVADLDALVAELKATMTAVTRAVRDWEPMLNRLRTGIGALEKAPAGQKKEPLRFLEWLTENNFTFLGMRDYRLEGDRLEPVASSGLGILREPEMKVLRSGSNLVESTPQHLIR